MIELQKASKVRLPDSVLQKQLDPDFVQSVKSYLKIGYPNYELLYVQGNFAVCLMNE
ncbi:hypothetical protein [Fervidibacillus albus]|uniref:Uncharacterized protein n=1 Tax=Fervidibacillus albus TaxID=2980026 RepID=A0A9E8RWP8_9BACI|nr:hypothetical protein [Fervidibacillus albus]WAA10308.1 hypothetical protein OE104_02945 [Fervidibacillus albus]